MNAINKTIANAIIDSIDSNEGNFSIEIEVDSNIFVEVDGCYETEGYIEDDYFNGTGACVTTYAMISVENIEAYDDDGKSVTVDCDLNDIEKYIENELIS